MQKRTVDCTEFRTANRNLRRSARFGSKLRNTARCRLLHSDLFPEFPCAGELIPVDALSTGKIHLLWCSGCGTEITYAPECDGDGLFTRE